MSLKTKHKGIFNHQGGWSSKALVVNKDSKGDRASVTNSISYIQWTLTRLMAALNFVKHMCDPKTKIYS